MKSTPHSHPIDLWEGKHRKKNKNKKTNKKKKLNNHLCQHTLKKVPILLLLRLAMPGAGEWKLKFQVLQASS